MQSFKRDFPSKSKIAGEIQYSPAISFLRISSLIFSASPRLCDESLGIMIADLGFHPAPRHLSLVPDRTFSKVNYSLSKEP